MKTYVLFDVRSVSDAERLGRYRREVLATVRSFGGRYLLAGGEPEVLEGTWRPVIPVLIEFPSRERAESWYGSEAYGSIKTLRTAASECQAVLLESTPSDLVTAN